MNAHMWKDLPASNPATSNPVDLNGFIQNGAHVPSPVKEDLEFERYDVYQMT